MKFGPHVLVSTLAVLAASAFAASPAEARTLTFMTQDVDEFVFEEFVSQLEAAGIDAKVVQTYDVMSSSESVYRVGSPLFDEFVTVLKDPDFAGMLDVPLLDIESKIWSDAGLPAYVPVAHYSYGDEKQLKYCLFSNPEQGIETVGQAKGKHVVGPMSWEDIVGGWGAFPSTIGAALAFEEEYGFDPIDDMIVERGPVEDGGQPTATMYAMDEWVKLPEERRKDTLVFARPPYMTMLGSRGLEEIPADWSELACIDRRLPAWGAEVLAVRADLPDGTKEAIGKAMATTYAVLKDRIAKEKGTGDFDLADVYDDEFEGSIRPWMEKLSARYREVAGRLGEEGFRNLSGSIFTTDSN